MFQGKTLTNLQERKAFLIRQSDTNRHVLAAEWRHLRTPSNWVDEAGRLAGDLARRHPVVTAVLSAVGGAMAFQTVRKPAAVVNGLDRMGKLASMAFSAWKLFKRVRGAEEKED